MSFEKREVLVKITPAGTISLPIQFRKFIDLQKGDYVKVILENNHLIVRKAVIT